MNSDDFFVDKVLDITIIFVLAMIILVFFVTMRSQINVFIMAYITYISLLILYYLIYMNTTSNLKKKGRHHSILNFISIFTLFLNLFTLAIIGNGYVNSNE